MVGTAGDGVDALEKARTLKPDVILMDIQMPRLDGLPAKRLIKAEQPEVKIVILTMSENDEDLFEAIKSGAQGYLLKADETDAFFENFQELMQGKAPLSAGISAGDWNGCFGVISSAREPMALVKLKALIE